MLFRQGCHWLAGIVTHQQGVPAGGGAGGQERDTTLSGEPSTPSISVEPFRALPSTEDSSSSIADSTTCHIRRRPRRQKRRLVPTQSTCEVLPCAPAYNSEPNSGPPLRLSPSLPSRPLGGPGRPASQGAVGRLLACGRRALLCCTGLRLSHVVGEAGVVLQPNLSFDPPPHHTILHRRCNGLSYRRCRRIESRPVLLVSRVTDLPCVYWTLADAFAPKTSSPPNPAGAHNKSLDVCRKPISRHSPIYNHSYAS